MLEKSVSFQSENMSEKEVMEKIRMALTVESAMME